MEVRGVEPRGVDLEDRAQPFTPTLPRGNAELGKWSVAPVTFRNGGMYSSRQLNIKNFVRKSPSFYNIGVFPIFSVTASLVCLYSLRRAVINRELEHVIRNSIQGDGGDRACSR